MEVTNETAYAIFVRNYCYVFAREDNVQELETCYVKNNNFEALLKDLLLVKQYRVEIWKKSNKTNEWTMTNHV
jgi:hypothetical protein